MFKIEKIVVPVDFSEDSTYAVEKAEEVAREFGARLYLMHVGGEVSHSERDALPVPAVIGRPHTEVFEECKVRLLEMVKDRERVAETVMRVGEVAEEIVSYAFSLKADLIVIATHGHRGLRHALLGSTTEVVVRRAWCPVLVVRHPKRVDTPQANAAPTA